MHFFILGSHPSLSIAEIAVVFGSSNDFSKASNEVLLLDGLKASPESMQDHLAGVTKVGTVARMFPDWDKDTLADALAELAHARLEKQGGPPSSPSGRTGGPAGAGPWPARRGKAVFGLSVYDLGNSQMAKGVKKQILSLGLEVKKRLKTQTERSVRFASSKETDLSSVFVKTNGLLDSAGEFVLMASAEGLVVGITEAVQDFKAWSDRDYGRPARDPKSGMLPPKLARLMVNLSGVDPKGATLLDPFCGSGTVLMEAGLMGFQKLMGNDVSPKAIADTRENLAWIADAVSFPSFELSVGPAEALNSRSVPPVDAIVTEPYLGPPLSGRESADRIRVIVRELAGLYEKSFRSLAGVLKPKGKLVAAFPLFRVGRETHAVPILPALQKIGFRVARPFPSSLPVGLRQVSLSGGIPYARPDQRVAREICVFERV